MTDALLTIEEAAAEPGCPLPPWRLYELANTSDLPHRRIGRRIYIPR